MRLGRMSSRHHRSIVGAALAGLAMLVLAACTPTRVPLVSGPVTSDLRVGITPDSPPMAFRRAGELAGLDVDLALRLGEELGRPVRFVVLPWRDQIGALLAGRTDVIMSGMTVTVGRETRVAFSRPYLRSGLAAMTRRADADRYDDIDALASTSAPVGVVAESTGERFVRSDVRPAMVAPYPKASAAVQELLQNRIDVFIHDIPTIVWYVGANEGELRVLRKRLNEEMLAWAFRPGDSDLRGAADAVLARWEADGTLARVVDAWLPYWSRIE